LDRRLIIRAAATFRLIGAAGERPSQTGADSQGKGLNLQAKKWGFSKKRVLRHSDSQIQLLRRRISMSNSMKALLAGAALAGLMTGTTARLNAQTLGQNQGKAGIKAVSMSDDGKDNDKTEKHACKGQNSCKGKGGCKSSDNGCKGENSCKGKGGCATDGSKMPDDQPKQEQN
jgi:hypothetical protein